MTLGCPSAKVCLGQSIAPSANTPTPRSVPVRSVEERVVLPEPVPDPIEPVNRVFWALNKGVMTAVIQPTARVYRFVVRRPVRKGIANFGRNITYPGRLINNLLQAKWTGARDETYRFGCNTVLGVLGFMDVASKFHIPKSDADFGQTFGQWGWKPNCFVMLPVFGPSNDRDTLGFAVDSAANPLTYLSPYPFTGSDPWTYLSPYTYYSYVVTYNNLSDSVDEYVRFSQTEKDAYSEVQYAWGFVRQNRVVDFQVKGEIDPAALETLESVFFTFQDPEFPRRGQTRSVLIPSTGKKLKFTSWVQKKPAPVVYIVPGLGSHRLATAALALAELVYQQGFSAVCVSSPFNYEFMEHASTAAVPGDTPVDGHDLHVALTAIDAQLARQHPGQLGARALLGYSMGAFQSLYIASQVDKDDALIHFDRYVAINTPVRLLHAISKLDQFYRAPLAWPAAERSTNIENTLLKVAALTQNSVVPQTSVPFSAVESRFLIGLVFRLILRDAIFSSQQRHNQGVLEHPIRTWRRDPLYREILQYSYNDYFQQFVIPAFASRLGPDPGGTLDRAGDLRSYGDSLKANSNLRFILNSNDFLLAPSDLEWLRATFAPEALTVFEKGGHLGNLAHPEVKRAILRALEDLPPQPLPLKR